MEPLTRALMDKPSFIAKLKEVGEGRYHYLHPYQIAMNLGELSPEQIRGWVANRYCYQLVIPRKDAAILSNCPVREVRRKWLHRITDHDGTAETGGGGLEAWLRLADAVGLQRLDLESGTHILPGVKFAVDAYLTFCKDQPWPVAISSSLTELFAPDLMRDRIEAFRQYYPWIPEWGFDYFKSRVTRARDDAGEAIDLTFEYCNTIELQEAAINALKFKCDILWSMLDSMALAYGRNFASMGRTGSVNIPSTPLQTHADPNSVMVNGS